MWQVYQWALCVHIKSDATHTVFYSGANYVTNHDKGKLFSIHAANNFTFMQTILCVTSNEYAPMTWPIWAKYILNQLPIYFISYSKVLTLVSSLHAIMLWCHSCTTHHICYLIMHKYTTYSRSEVRIIHRFLMLRWATYIQIWNATCLVPNAISDCLYSYWKFYHEDETFMRPLWDSGYSHETLGHSKKTCYIGGT